MVRFARFVLSVAMLALVIFGALGNAGLTLAQSPSAAGMIAYTPADTRNAIRLINPDGSGDRQLWSTGRADLEGADDIWNIAWRPDGGALAYTSTHEEICSINHADVFSVNADGTGYRRVTEAPSCAALQTFPQGQVRVPVTNSSYSDSFSGFVYFQGASSAQMVNLPPRGIGLVTFPSVADFGAGELQVGAFFVGSQRKIDVGTAADVVAGGSVTTGQLFVYPLSIYDFWETHSSTYRYGGQKIAYVLNFNSVRGISPNPAALDFGEPLLNAEQSSMSDFVSYLAYGPTAATANQMLYVGSTSYETGSVFLVTEGSTTAGTPLVTHDSTDMILGLAWLPDASGFVYSVMETEYDPEYTVSSNIFLYTFATQNAVRITSMKGEFAEQLSVSPDSQQIVFERSQKENPYGDAEKTDLWIVNRNGSGLRLLKTNAAAPAWNLIPAPGQVDYDNQMFLPYLRR